MRTGTVNAPLHGGHCPPWLFAKMKELGSVIMQVIVYEYGPSEVLRRLSDPIWFQTFGSVLGFDWHSSGLTTVVCGALKEGLSDMQGELGIFLTGGKGKVSRKTPLEILKVGEKYALSNDLISLQRTSRLVAKVDSAAVQDGYQLYHHFFVFDGKGNWAVVQQGMNEITRYARRYHWLSEDLKSYVDDPHKGICGKPNADVLNLVSSDNIATRKASVELCKESPEQIIKVLKSLSDRTLLTPNQSQQLSLWESNASSFTAVKMPQIHSIPSTSYINKILYQVYDRPPESYEHLLEVQGVGPSTLRALAMVAEVTHGVKPSFKDPVRYAFAHGGKDGFPYPVNRDDMSHSINVLQTAIEKAKIGDNDKMDALKRLAHYEKYNNKITN